MGRQLPLWRPVAHTTGGAATVLKDILTPADLDAEDLHRVLDLAHDLKRRQPRDGTRRLEGELVVLYFTATSTRTRITFGTAASRLGATVVALGPAEFQKGYGGTPETLGRIISIYASAIVARTDEATLARIAGCATIPVLNGMSDRHD